MAERGSAIKFILISTSLLLPILVWACGRTSKPSEPLLTATPSEDTVHVLLEFLHKASDLTDRYDLETAQAESAFTKGQLLSKTLPERWEEIDRARLEAFDNLYAVYQTRLSDTVGTQGQPLMIRSVLDGYYSLKVKLKDGSTDWAATVKRREIYANGLDKWGQYLIWSASLPSMEATDPNCRLILGDRPETILKCWHFDHSPLK